MTTEQPSGLQAQLARIEMKLDIFFKYVQMQEALEHAREEWSRSQATHYRERTRESFEIQQKYGETVIGKNKALGALISEYMGLDTPGHHPYSRKFGDLLSDGTRLEE